MALWDYPADHNVTNYTAMIKYVNYTTGDAFGTLMCIAIFIVVFVALKNYNTAKALSAAAFLSTVITTLFYILGLVSYYVIVVFVTLTVIGALYPMLKGES